MVQFLFEGGSWLAMDVVGGIEDDLKGGVKALSLRFVLALGWEVAILG